jgi:hypothetical protein
MAWRSVKHGDIFLPLPSSFQQEVFNFGQEQEESKVRLLIIRGIELSVVPTAATQL